MRLPHCVIKDGHDSGADVGRRLREYHTVAGQAGVLGFASSTAN
jgi:hypothetical protein